MTRTLQPLRHYSRHVLALWLLVLTAAVLSPAMRAAASPAPLAFSAVCSALGLLPATSLAPDVGTSPLLAQPHAPHALDCPLCLLAAPPAAEPLQATAATAPQQLTGPMRVPPGWAVLYLPPSRAPPVQPVQA